jgi:hypothetical protein
MLLTLPWYHERTDVAMGIFVFVIVSLISQPYVDDYRVLLLVFFYGMSIKRHLPSREPTGKPWSLSGTELGRVKKSKYD